jgi:hypothetical protein
MPQLTRAGLAFAAALLCAATGCRFPTGRIEGTVRDRSGQPIAHVSVGVLGLAHREVSDTSGKYRISSVPVGAHRLRATLVGYASLERDSVVVRQGLTTRVDFTLDRMWTEGQATQSLGGPRNFAGPSVEAALIACPHCSTPTTFPP